MRKQKEKHEKTKKSMYIREKIPIVSSHHCLIFVRKLGGSDEKANVER